MLMIVLFLSFGFCLLSVCVCMLFERLWISRLSNLQENHYLFHFRLCVRRIRGNVEKDRHKLFGIYTYWIIKLLGCNNIRCYFEYLIVGVCRIAWPFQSLFFYAISNFFFEMCKTFITKDTTQKKQWCLMVMLI